jgi:hypothetical protein
LPIQVQGQPELLHVAEAGRLTGGIARLREDGEEDRRKDGYYGDHDEQLDEGEAPGAGLSMKHRRLILSAALAAAFWFTLRLPVLRSSSDSFGWRLIGRW